MRACSIAFDRKDGLRSTSGWMKGDASLRGNHAKRYASLTNGMRDIRLSLDAALESGACRPFRLAGNTSEAFLRREDKIVAKRISWYWGMSWYRWGEGLRSRLEDERCRI